MAERFSSASLGRLIKSNAIPAQVSPTTVDLAWAAGFMEGEGSFMVNRKSLGRNACARCSAAQKQREPLDKLQRLFGGGVKPFKGSYFRWDVSGARARGVMLTLFTFLSTRRRGQVRAALGIGAEGMSIG